MQTTFISLVAALAAVTSAIDDFKPFRVKPAGTDSLLSGSRNINEYLGFPESDSDAEPVALWFDDKQWLNGKQGENGEDQMLYLNEIGKIYDTPLYAPAFVSKSDANKTAWAAEFTADAKPDDFEHFTPYLPKQEGMIFTGLWWKCPFDSIPELKDSQITPPENNGYRVLIYSESNQADLEHKYRDCSKALDMIVEEINV